MFVNIHGNRITWPWGELSCSSNTGKLTYVLLLHQLVYITCLFELHCYYMYQKKSITRLAIRGAGHNTNILECNIVVEMWDICMGWTSRVLDEQLNVFDCLRSHKA